MFTETLKDLVLGTEGGVASLLMDSSGIALESFVREGSDLDITTVGIEFSVVLGSIKRASEMLDAGGARELSIGTEKYTTLIRVLGDSYFLALALEPDGNFGKGRYLMRTAVPKLLADL